MKVLVIGAGGKTGKLVVQRSLAAGHTVTALVHADEEHNDKEHFLRPSTSFTVTPATRLASIR